jgi:hypothetical protein
MITMLLDKIARILYKLRGIDCARKHCGCYYAGMRCCICKNVIHEDDFLRLHPNSIETIEPIREALIHALKFALEVDDHKQYLYSREMLRWMNWIKDNQDRIKL